MAKRKVRAWFTWALAFASGPLHATGVPYLTTDDARALQRRHGIRALARGPSDGNLYAFHSDGVMLISRRNFGSPREARTFCEAHPGFALGDRLVPFLLVMTGLPFAELWPTSLVQLPVLGTFGTQPGPLFWTEANAMDYPETGEAIRQDDFVFSMTDANRCESWAPAVLSDINRRLEKADIPPVSLPAVCVDRDLAGVFSGRH